jgi:hypothetical protein
MAGKVVDRDLAVSVVKNAVAAGVLAWDAKRE